MGFQWSQLASMNGLTERKQSFMSACRNCIDFSKMHNDVYRVPEGKIKLIRLFKLYLMLEHEVLIDPFKLSGWTICFRNYRTFFPDLAVLISNSKFWKPSQVQGWFLKIILFTTTLPPSFSAMGKNINMLRVYSSAKIYFLFLLRTGLVLFSNVLKLHVKFIWENIIIWKWISC